MLVLTKDSVRASALHVLFSQESPFSIYSWIFVVREKFGIAYLFWNIIKNSRIDKHRYQIIHFNLSKSRTTGTFRIVSCAWHFNSRKILDHEKNLKMSFKNF
jgi:hypothetical protein